MMNTTQNLQQQEKELDILFIIENSKALKSEFAHILEKYIIASLKYVYYCCTLLTYMICPSKLFSFYFFTLCRFIKNHYTEPKVFIYRQEYVEDFFGLIWI